LGVLSLKIFIDKAVNKTRTVLLDKCMKKISFENKTEAIIFKNDVCLCFIRVLIFGCFFSEKKKALSGDSFFVAHLKTHKN
jgi:hypothetical protein